MVVFALGAGDPAAQTKTPPKGEDPPTGRILYFEETGGIITSVAPPKAPAGAPPKTPVSAPKDSAGTPPQPAAPTRLPPPLPPRLVAPKAPVPSAPAPGKQSAARKSPPTPIISP